MVILETIYQIALFRPGPFFPFRAVYPTCGYTIQFETADQVRVVTWYTKKPTSLLSPSRFFFSLLPANRPMLEQADPLLKGFHVKILSPDDARIQSTSPFQSSTSATHEKRVKRWAGNRGLKFGNSKQLPCFFYFHSTWFPHLLINHIEKTNQ